METDVVVVGGSLSGLSTALFLARRGIRVVLLEQHEQTSIYPKAAGQNPRTMELLRFAGVAAEVSQAVDIRGRDGDFTIRVVETVPGRVLHSFAESFDELVGATEQCTPMPWALAAQDNVEPVLRAAAERAGADVRFGTRMTGFELPSEEEVRVRFRALADGETGECSARYLVAADGPRSGVRAQLGITSSGFGTLAHFIGVIFAADLDAVLPPGSNGWYYLQNPQFTATFGPTDDPHRHTFYVQYDPARGESAKDFTEHRCTELIRLALAAPDLTPKLLDVQAWEMAAHIADRWRVGPVLLVGDAAKVTPPTGGMGGNAAIADGFDAAWKLASVIREEAGHGLLDTYADERRQAAQLVVDESLAIYAERMAPHLLAEVPKARGTAEVLMGFRYRSSAALAEDTDPAPVEDPLNPSGRPGFRAPHVWVRNGNVRTSTVELFGAGWVVIAGSGGGAWREAAERVAEDLGIELTCYVLGEDIVDDERGDDAAASEFAARYGLGPGGATVVRPDGVVAWRARTPPADQRSELGRVLRAVLHR